MTEQHTPYCRPDDPSRECSGCGHRTAQNPCPVCRTPAYSDPGSDISAELHASLDKLQERLTNLTNLITHLRQENEQLRQELRVIKLRRAFAPQPDDSTANEQI